MYDLNEKLSYLKGLVDGLGIKEEGTKEGRVISGILSLLEDMVDEIVDLDISYSELDTYVEHLSEDLADVEDRVYCFDDDLDFDIDYDDEDDTELICPNCHGIMDEDELDENDPDLICPHCNYVIFTNSYLEDDPLDEDILE